MARDAGADVDDDHGHDLTDAGGRVGRHLGDGRRRVGTVESVTNGAPKFRHDPEMPGPLEESPDVSDGSTSTLQRERISSVTDDEVRLHGAV